MASSARRVVVEFLGDDKSASRVARSVDGSTSKLGATFARVGKAAAIGLAAGVVVAGAALVKFGKDAVADEAAQVKLANTLKNTTGATDDQVKSVESWITKQGQALGVTDDELRPALSKLAVATGDVGKAQELASLAMDASAGTGKSLESVSAALAKAQNGNVSALARLGIETKNAKGETLSFDQVTKNMAATFKGQAATQADTLQGKMARLKLILNEAGETIGAKLIPVVTQLADFFLNRIMPALAQTSDYIKANVVPVLKEMGSWFKRNIDAIGPIAGILLAAAAATKVYSTATKVATGITKAFVVMQRILNGTMRLNPIGLVITALAALGVAFVIAYKKSATFRKIVDNAFAKVKTAVREALGVIRSVLKTSMAFLQAAWRRFGGGILDVMRNTWRAVQGVVKGAFTIIKGLFKVVRGVLTGDWRQLWSGVKDILRGAWGIIMSVIRGGLSNLKVVMREAWSAIRDIVRTAWSTVMSAIRDGLSNLRGLMRDAWSAMRDIVRDAWSGIRDVARTGIDNLVDSIRGIPDRLRNMAASWGSAARALIGAFVDGLKNAGGIVSGIAGNVWDAVKSMLNTAISRINSALNFSISIPGPNISVNAGQIPYLAAGTRNFAGGLAVVGERGPELVNLPRGSQVTPNSRLGGGSADVANLTVNLSLDGKTVQKVLLKLKRTNGGLALGLA